MDTRPRVKEIVIKFMHEMVDERRTEFTMKELMDYCETYAREHAPDRPGRVLRELKSEGQIEFECIDQSRGRYRC